MLTGRKPLVFISSTSDLGEERASIAKALPRSVEPYLYEEDTARRQSPRERLTEILASTDAFVGIVGERYGSPYPDCQGDRSIVEWEFDTAKAQDHTELFAFKKADMRPEDIEPEQQDFLGRLTQFASGIWLKTFASSDELRVEVLRAMVAWLTSYWEASLEQREADHTEASPFGRMLRWGLPLLIAASLATLGTVLVGQVFDLTNVEIGWLCIVVAIVTLGTMLLIDR